MKHSFTAKAALPAVTALLAAAVLTACSGGNYDPDEPLYPLYTAKAPNIANGAITPVPERGIAGAKIQFVVNPAPGFRLEKNVFQLHVQGVSNIDGGNGTNISADTQGVFSHDMERGGVWITANFIPLSAGQYSVSVSIPGGHGYVVPSVLYGRGPQTVDQTTVYTTVGLTTIPDQGYLLKSIAVENGEWTDGEHTAFTISGAGNVIVTAVFEKAANAGELLALADKALNQGQYDTAFSYYEAAYLMDNANTTAVVYSSLGKLLSIGNDANVKAALKKPNIPASAYFPGSINGWLDFSAGPQTWLRVYTKTDGSTVTLPTLGINNVFPGNSYDNAYYKGGSDTREAFNNILLWNMIGGNPDGFNDLLDDSLAYIFGANFEEAMRRIGALDYTERAVFNQALKEHFGLEEAYPEGASIGRADLEVITGTAQAVKGLFEWLAAYDWRTDMTGWRVFFTIGMDLNDVLTGMVEPNSGPLTTLFERYRNWSFLSGFLPFRGRLLRVRDSAMTAKAKADVLAGASSLRAAFEGLSPEARSHVAPWLIDGVTTLNETLKAGAGGVFYLPAIAADYPPLFPGMKGRASWVTPEEAAYAVDLGKFFTPGSLSIDRLAETVKGGGKVPVFYGKASGASVREAVTEASDLSRYESFTWKLGPGFKEVFPLFDGAVTAQKAYYSDLFPGMDFTQSNGAWLYSYYQKR